MRCVRTDVGAVATFTGLVRDVNDGSGVHAMTLEHYPGMTESALEDIVAQAKARLEAAMASYRRTLAVQSRIAANVSAAMASVSAGTKARRV